MLIGFITTNYPTEFLFFAEGVVAADHQNFTLHSHRGGGGGLHGIIAKAYEGRTKCHLYY